MAKLTEEEIRELVKKEQLTRTETLEYCKKMLGIEKDTYYRYVYHRLKPYFGAMFVDPAKREAAMIKISKRKVDEVIALIKKRIEDKALKN